MLPGYPLAGYQSCITWWPWFADGGHVVVPSLNFPLSLWRCLSNSSRCGRIFLLSVEQLLLSLLILDFNLEWGSQMEAAYSSCGRTGCHQWLGAGCLTSFGHIDKFLIKKDMVLLAFFKTASVHEFQGRVLSMVMPKYLALLVHWRVWPWILYVLLMTLRLLVMRMTLHLSGLNIICTAEAGWGPLEVPWCLHQNL